MKNWRISLMQDAVLVEFPIGTKVKAQLLEGVYRELNSDPERYRNINAVWDFRNTLPDESIGFEQLIKVVRRFKAQRQAEWKQTKTALVVNDKTTYGMVRMYSSLAEGTLDYQVNIFEDDMQAAIEWAQPAD